MNGLEKQCNPNTDLQSTRWELAMKLQRKVFFIIQFLDSPYLIQFFKPLQRSSTRTSFMSTTFFTYRFAKILEKKIWNVEEVKFRTEKYQNKPSHEINLISQKRKQEFVVILEVSLFNMYCVANKCKLWLHKLWIQWGHKSISKKSNCCRHAGGIGS